jgi:ribonuclease E
VEPPEVVSIEMTPEEQDVYALMGISPLVRLNREVKNPKSVILSVVLPGESDQAETLNQPPVEASTEAPVHSFASYEAETPEQEFETSFAEIPATDEAETAERGFASSFSEAPDTEIQTDLTFSGESDSSRPLIRRRRRRSSAMDNDE